MPTSSLSDLFQPFHLKSLTLKNRFVMAPMTRQFSPNGVPTADVTAYYRRRAEGEVGLILSEGTVIERPASAGNPAIPHFYGEQALAGWKDVIDGVHQAGGAMGPQIWHVGITYAPSEDGISAIPEGPSGIRKPGEKAGNEMTEADIADTIAAYARAAGDAKRLGFDMVEIHGAHGYLIDQFLWKETNERTDAYGGTTVAGRTKFAVDVVGAVRAAVGDDFVVCLRLSQWKLGDYNAKLAETAGELEEMLTPLSEAGVDLFHCSQRRFWDPEFEDSDLNFAGWAKKITGKPTITVGSVGLSNDFINTFSGQTTGTNSLDELVRRYERGDFDLVAIGRVLLSDPHWVQKIREGRADDLIGFTADVMGKLV